MSSPQQNPQDPRGGVCRTAHPEPGRLLSLGDAARRTRTPLLELRAAIRDGRLRTLPALHLGQPIRLVEPVALQAAFPEAILQAGPRLDPVTRGINWIGTSQGEEPPGSVPMTPRAAQNPHPSQARKRAAASAKGEPTPPTPRVVSGPLPESEVPPSAALAGGTISEPEQVPPGAGSDPDPAPSPERLAPPQTPASEDLPEVQPMGGNAPPPVQGGDRLADLFGGENPPQDNQTPGRGPATGEVLCAPSAPQADSFEGGRFSGEPLLGGRGVSGAVQLGAEVRRFEARSLRRRIGVQFLLVMGSGLLVSAWMWSSSEGHSDVLAASTSVVETTEGRKSGPIPLMMEDVSSADSLDSNKQSSETPLQTLAPPIIRVLDAPRASGPPCVWWDVTQPLGALRSLLGPCQGPWNEETSVVVGLHRHKGVQTCTHHLAFLRDRGGNLSRETSAANAAKLEDLPAPLMTLRVEGAARRMLRERVGNWIESGFEAGGRHHLGARLDGSWRVSSWVRLSQLQGEARLRRFELDLELADGPHLDRELKFTWLSEPEPSGR